MCQRSRANRNTACPSLRRVLATFLFWNAALSQLIGQQDQPASDAHSISTVASDTLFDRRSFSKWTQSGNWKIAKGALHCAGIPDEAPTDLHYSPASIPPNADIIFEWRFINHAKAVKAAANGVYPALAISMNTSERGVRWETMSYGAAVDYCVGNIKVRVHTRDAADRSPIDNMWGSGFSCYASVKARTKPSGEWNVSRISFDGSLMDLWFNGVRLYHVNFEKKTIQPRGLSARKMGDPRIVGQAIGKWLNRTEGQLYLSVMAPYDPTDGRHVEIRSIRCRPSKTQTDAPKTPD